MATTLDELEEGLKRYCQLMGSNYDEEKGLKAHCDENGIEDIQEELMDNGVDDCMLLDFDENIPFNKKYAKEKDKKKAIYDLLRKIYENPNCDFNEESNSHEPLKLKPIDFKVKKSEIDSMKKIYEAQLVTIFEVGMQNDKNIMKALAISAKIDAPYLIYCADLFSRDRITAHLRGEDLNAATWAKKNKHCLQINKIGSKQRDIIQHAVSSFFHRIVPRLLFGVSTKICDSLAHTTKYLATAIAFVHDIAAQKNETCPFQFDTCIAYDRVRSVEKIKPINEELGGAISDDYSSDVSSASVGIGGDNDEINGKMKDYFGNIKEKLQKEECLHEIGINDDEDTNKRSVRAFKKTYEKFKTNKVFTKYKDKEYREYPRNRRFCSFVDRRRKNVDNDDEKKQNGVINADEIIFFEPPKNCNLIPKKAVPLWFFDSSKTCIVPNIGYNEAMNSDKKVKASKELIYSGSQAGGSLLTLSFHVEAVDNIRCYLYLNGQMTRFFAADVVDLLPRYFDDSKENLAFVKSKDAKEMVDDMKKKLRDLRFEAFYNEYKM